MDRRSFAERISSGLAGWFQQLAAQNLQNEVGEDAARVELVRMISAQKNFEPKTSQRPSNWPAQDKRRIDVAVLGRSAGAKGWYGAIELKWPGTANDVAQVRADIVQDAIRVAFSSTTNMNAHFLILGGTTAALKRIFVNPHQNVAKDSQRIALNSLLSTNMSAAGGQLTNANLLSNFPSALARIDSTITTGWTRRFATELIASVDAKIGDTVQGSVYVWQCRK